MITWQEFDNAFRKAEMAEDFGRCAEIEAEAEHTLSEEDFELFIVAGNPADMDKDKECE